MSNRAHRSSTALHLRRAQALLFLAVLALCTAVWVAAATQRAASDEVAAEVEANTALLVTMLDQETGVRGYIISGETSLLQPYRDALIAFEEIARTAQRTIGHLPALQQEIAKAREWQALAAVAVGQVDAGHNQTAVDGALARKTRMDAFRAANAVVDQLIERDARPKLPRLAAF